MMQVFVGLYIVFIFCGIYILNLVWFKGILQLAIRSVKGNNQKGQKTQ